MGFPRQEHWSGLPFPFPQDLPNPGIEPASPALAGRFFTAALPGTPIHKLYSVYYSYYTHMTWSPADADVGSVGLSRYASTPTPPYPDGLTWPRHGSSPHVRSGFALR